MEEIDLLPDYIKIAYKFIMSVGEEFASSAEKEGKPFAIPYYIESVRPTFIYTTTFVNSYMRYQLEICPKQSQSLILIF